LKNVVFKVRPQKSKDASNDTEVKSKIANIPEIGAKSIFCPSIFPSIYIQTVFTARNNLSKMWLNQGFVPKEEQGCQ